MSRWRISGSAHAGLGEWLIQRATSLYLGAFFVYLLACLVANPLPDYLAWRAWFTHGAVRLAWGLFFLCLLAHAWIGLRSVLIDYARPTWLRALLQGSAALLLLSFALWAAQILFTVGKDT